VQNSKSAIGPGHATISYFEAYASIAGASFTFPKETAEIAVNEDLTNNLSSLMSPARYWRSIDHGLMSLMVPFSTAMSVKPVRTRNLSRVRAVKQVVLKVVTSAILVPGTRLANRINRFAPR
jgi:hypothetical protein